MQFNLFSSLQSLETCKYDRVGGQASRQAGEQAGRQVGMQAAKQAVKQRGRKAGRQMSRQEGRRAGPVDRLTDGLYKEVRGSDIMSRGERKDSRDSKVNSRRHCQNVEWPGGGGVDG